jgi:hypothetical protein
MRRTHAFLMCAITVGCAGAPTEPLPGAETPTLRVTPTRYELDLTVDYEAETFSGRARIEVTNLADTTVNEIPFLLYRLLKVSDVRGAGGRPLPFVQTVVPFRDFGKLQVNFVRVRLPNGLPPQASATVQLDYAGHLLGYAETGMLYVQDRIAPDFTILRMDSFSYPQPGYPSFAANEGVPLPTYAYTARITVPDALTVANGGRLTAHSVVDGRATFTFENIRPAWRMDFAIADYRTLEEGPVRVVHFPQDAEGAQRVLAAVQASLRLFSEWFGPLQSGGGFTFIEIPDGWGSQADVTSVIQTAAAFKDPERIGEVYHEISHLWNPPSTDASSPRWNEGLAEFLEVLAGEHLHDLQNRGIEIAKVLEDIRGRFTEQPRYREIPMVDYGVEQVTGLSYRVGLVMFEVLHRLVGHKQFVQIVGEYYRLYADTGGTTDEFVRLADRVTDRDLEQFFDDWMYTSRWYGLVESGANTTDLVDQYR